MLRILFRLRLFICPLLCILFPYTVSPYGISLKSQDTVNYSRFGDQPPLSKELHKLLEAQIQWDAGVDDINPSHLHLRFVKIEEATTGKAAPQRYRVFIDGAPENKIFSFGYWPLGKDIAYDPRDIYVNGQGLLMLHKPRPDEELSLKAGDDEFTLTPVTGSAEPFRFVFSRRDGLLQIYNTLVPHPVASEEQGCRLEARLAQADATAVLLIIDGFPAKSKIPLVLESEGEQASAILTTDSNGHAVTATLPYVGVKTQGTLKVSAEGPNCLPSIVLPWGPGTHPLSTTPQQ
jgi:hypothetical protein